MSLPEAPHETEARQILMGLAAVGEKLDRLIAAVNGLGANQQWLVDNVKGIFQMFGSPQFMSMLGPMLAGGMPGALEEMGEEENGPEDGPEDGAADRPADELID